MTTQGQRDPQPADRTPEGRAARARHATRGLPARALGWCVVVAVVAGGGWIVSRPHPGDWIPGLGPSSADAAKTPPVVGNPLPPSGTDQEGLTADRYFPAQRAVEMGAYKGRRNGARQGQDCAETLQARETDPLQGSGCQGYVTVSFSAVDQPALLSSVTVLRFPDDASAAKAAQALRAGHGPAEALVFILPDASAAPVPAAAAGKPADPAKPADPGKVEAVGHFLTVTVSRFAESRTAAPSPGPTASGTAGAPEAPPAPATGSAAASTTPSAPAGPSQAQLLDLATRAVSYAAGAQFIWT
ncbi:hypothetical protein GCM10010495_53290 [Kitasatospora herbaricolor]|uniref:hypothetical protein n=1 Tax=Kitasatospora herbaricolor TaxID=68217 RepID=UPI00174A23DE|nr:hypothetical protein [Kitasatospora herbaricolor]MDQ0312507.1 hypothetical protein [Kitasatospora herbaricolor]GGV30231.1 hypothetical protein GCM10010495_53290 [Kitasatospora herbaricolor]